MQMILEFILLTILITNVISILRLKIAKVIIQNQCNLCKLPAKLSKRGMFYDDGLLAHSQNSS
jgi:hypothetical protein